MKLHIDSYSLQRLSQQGYSLYLFKGFKDENSKNKLSKTAVWFVTDDYMEENMFSWSDHYSGYVSKTSSRRRTGSIQRWTRMASFPGDCISITDHDGHICPNRTDRRDGNSNYFSFMNTTKKEITVGYTLKNPDRKDVPICAIPLFAGQNVSIQPLDKVFIQFSLASLPVGSVVSKPLPGDGILLDFCFEEDVSLAYEIDKGWTVHNNSIAQVVLPSQNKSFSEIWNA